MGRTFIVTDEQLREAADRMFAYFGDDTDVSQYDGFSNTAVTSPVGDEEYGQPTTTDKVAHSRIPQTYARYRMYGHAGNTFMKEDVNDKNGDGVDDFYNNEELDILGDNDDTNNLQRIPKGIEQKANALVRYCQGLTPKQRAMVLNQFIEQLDIASVPYAWKKELMKKVML